MTSWCFVLFKCSFGYSTHKKWSMGRWANGPLHWTGIYFIHPGLTVKFPASISWFTNSNGILVGHQRWALHRVGLWIHGFAAQWAQLGPADVSIFGRLPGCARCGQHAQGAARPRSQLAVFSGISAVVTTIIIVILISVVIAWKRVIVIIVDEYIYIYRVMFWYRCCHHCYHHYFLLWSTMY